MTITVCIHVHHLFPHLGYKSWLPSQDHSWKKADADTYDDDGNYVNSGVNDDDRNGDADDYEKPGRVEQALPGPEKIGSDNLQKNHLFWQIYTISPLFLFANLQENHLFYNSFQFIFAGTFEIQQLFSLIIDCQMFSEIILEALNLLRFDNMINFHRVSFS